MKIVIKNSAGYIKTNFGKSNIFYLRSDKMLQRKEYKLALFLGCLNNFNNNYNNNWVYSILIKDKL